MAWYKGVQIDDALLKLIGRMPRVDEYRENLQSLQSVWDSLTLLGNLSGAGADMSETRTAFQSLTGSLLNQLGRETLKKTVLEMNSKAQVAVDIMVRNLFERTADIGFLALDGKVRDYLAFADALRGTVCDDAAQAEFDAAGVALRAHFDEYVRKYSVYSNIILLDRQGEVLLQLDDARPVRRTDDPLVAESLATRAAYVETFRKTDLLPGEDAGLIYSSRVTNAQSGAALGVLCLCFRFANETQRIFANLGDAQDWSVVTLLDGDGRVIASSDPHHIPAGATLRRVLDADWEVVRYAGREYLATTRATQGYQGYGGPGWFGHVMLPLEHAFVAQEGQEQADLQPGVLEAVMGNSRLFNADLREIPVQARRIQRGLNRSVWNGSVRQNDAAQALNPAFSKVLLWEISNTGFKTQDVFERSIGNLHQTVVSSILQDSRFRAALAIDIMDRNLYERANDCRWWALAPLFRELLSSGTPDAAAMRQAGETLAHINGLYTVYDNLVLFDRSGRVLAVSNPRFEGLRGEVLDQDWVRQSLALGDSQSYAVSRFAATPLYDGRHTYIYAAAVFAPGEQRSAVGGVGIVFDAAPQFAAMLQDALPRDENGAVPPGCFGVFADRGRNIIASTQPGLEAGATLELDPALFGLAQGAGVSRIAEYQGSYYAVGASMSSGYREYKGAGDAYRNDVVALIFVPLGEQQARRHAAPAARARTQARSAPAGGGATVEIATFHVDSHWVGIPSQHVIEAIDLKHMTRATGAGSDTLSYLMFRGEPVPVVGLPGMAGGSGGPLPGNRLPGADRQGSAPPGAEQQIVILELAPGRRIGVLVDDLGEMQNIRPEQVEKIAGILGGAACLTEGLVKPDAQDDQAGMLMLLSPERLRQSFLTHH